MQLSDAQTRFFETFGFLSFPGLLTDQIGAITAAFESVWQQHGGGHAGQPHEGNARSCIVPFIDQSESLAALLDDPRILGIARGLLGDDFNYMGSDGNYYVGDTGWHSDGWHSALRHVKIALYLDPLTRDTGCLRVLPGSHCIGDRYAETLQHQIRESAAQWNVSGEQIPALALETQPGDLLCFDHNLKHAAFGGGTRRRMFTINLCQRYPEERLDDLRGYIAGHARFWIERNYGDIMMQTAGPERMRHLEQVMANDGHLAELARAERAKRTEPSRG